MNAEQADKLLDGLTVDTSRQERPVLLDGTGRPLKTWRENHPYGRKVGRTEYERRKRVLQIELLKLQRWVRDTGARVIVVCEGRDAAGKGGTIQRLTERLNPRGARVVALDRPTERETGQWYFQRYIAHLPTAGEIVFFDRSWYNRAACGACDGLLLEGPVRAVPRTVPGLRADARRRRHPAGQVLVLRVPRRAAHPFRHPAGRPGAPVETLPTDVASLDRWDDYTEAKVDMFRATDTESAPWTVVKSNDKRRARLETMRSLLSRIDYTSKDPEAVGTPDPLIVGAANTLLEPGEEDTTLSPTPLSHRTSGPGSHPEST